MSLSFAKSPSPILVSVITEETKKAAMAAITNSIYNGATGIDLHLSCMKEEERTVDAIKQIVNMCKVPILALNYDVDMNREVYQSEEEERIDILLKAAEAGVACIDFQGYTLDRESKYGFRQEFSNMDYSFVKVNPREVVMDDKVIEKQMELFEKVRHMGTEVLLSCHPGVVLSAEQVVDLALYLEKRGPDVIKIVTLSRNRDDLIESFKSMHLLKKEVKTPISYHLSGQEGKLSRIINPVLGGHIAFCNDRFNTGSDLNQLDLRTAKTAIDAMNLMKGKC